MERPPVPLAKEERDPQQWEAVESYLGLTAEEKEMMATCTHEHKEHVIAWRVREEERAAQDPTGREGILLEFKAGGIQFMIAKDMSQRQEAFEQLSAAKYRAEQENQPDLVDMANQLMDMLDAI